MGFRLIQFTNLPPSRVVLSLLAYTQFLITKDGRIEFELNHFDRMLHEYSGTRLYKISRESQNELNMAEV
jgi:hypothetical protein